MEDSRLKAFCLIVEMKSFSRAAEAAFVTQSAMSHLIRNLEDEMGGRLLNRSGKTVTPTSMGRILYGHARRILDEYKAMDDNVSEVVKRTKGPLNIGASVTVARYLLPQVLYDFSRRYPEAQINLSVSSPEKVTEQLRQGKIDIGITEGDGKEPQIVCTDIACDEIVLIASDGHPLAKKKVLTAQDLRAQSFLMPEVGSGTREFIDGCLRRLRIDPRDIHVIMTLSDPELLVQMVQTGLGIAFVSKWSIFKAMKEGTINLAKMSGKKLCRKFYLLTLDREPSTRVARMYLEFVKGYRFFVPF